MREHTASSVSPGTMASVLEYYRNSEHMARYDASHDFSHIQRVTALANEIGRAEKKEDPAFSELDWNMISLAATFHDIGDKKYVHAGEDGATLAQKTMIALGIEEAMARAVQTIINNVSYSHEVKYPEEVQQALRDYPELAIVQDADRLDALGAVGIGRAFTYGAARGRAMEETVNHFSEKLEKLEPMMKTKSGKALARMRVERLQQFRTWWAEETGTCSS